ncbi:MAG: inorganic diphosphatase [Weeksellaceae bacterium]|jgi:inorganic pyrophosphatase
MKFNPWHHVTVGEEQPDIVQSIIEIPQGSKAKYELDKASGMLRLDRVLFSSVSYPHNYGFIPQTLGEDNDPLDIIVLSQIAVDPMCIVEAKVIGVLRMIDNGEGDDKIIAVAQHDMSVNHINEVSELPPHLTVELQNFFEDYKKLENKLVVVEDFQNAEVARKIVSESIENYNRTYPKKKK